MLSRHVQGEANNKQPLATNPAHTVMEQSGPATDAPESVNEVFEILAFMHPFLPARLPTDSKRFKPHLCISDLLSPTSVNSFLPSICQILTPLKPCLALPAPLLNGDFCTPSSHCLAFRNPFHQASAGVRASEDLSAGLSFVKLP